jgi:hypothetical protein
VEARDEAVGDRHADHLVRGDEHRGIGIAFAVVDQQARTARDRERLRIAIELDAGREVAGRALDPGLHSGLRMQMLSGRSTYGP